MTTDIETDSSDFDAAFEAVESEAASMDFAREERKWLLAIHQTTKDIFTEDQLSPLARVSYDRFLRAAFDRMGRICRGDIVEGESR